MSFTLNRNIGHRGELRLSRRLSLATPRTCPQCLAQVATPSLLRGPPQLSASFIPLPRQTPQPPPPRLPQQPIPSRHPTGSPTTQPPPRRNETPPAPPTHQNP